MRPTLTTLTAVQLDGRTWVPLPDGDGTWWMLSEDGASFWDGPDDVRRFAEDLDDESEPGIVLAYRMVADIMEAQARQAT